MHGVLQLGLGDARHGTLVLAHANLLLDGSQIPHTRRLRDAVRVAPSVVLDVEQGPAERAGLLLHGDRAARAGVQGSLRLHGSDLAAELGVLYHGGQPVKVTARLLDLAHVAINVACGTVLGGAVTHVVHGLEQPVRLADRLGQIADELAGLLLRLALALGLGDHGGELRLVGLDVLLELSQHLLHAHVVDVVLLEERRAGRHLGA